MSGPPKEGKVETQGGASQRSTRLFISIPVTISGKDAAGNTFKENTRTLCINKQGAKLATVHQLGLGAEISVENLALKETAKANIIWFGEKRGPTNSNEIGIQLLNAGNIWGIEFPLDDGEEDRPIATPREASNPTGMRTQSRITEAAPSPMAAKPVATATSVQADSSKPIVAKAEGGQPSPIAPPGQIDAAVESALGRFTHAIEVAAEQQSKTFEEKLAKLTQQVGLQTQVTLQEAANSLRDKVLGSINQQLDSLSERQKAARVEGEGLVAKLQEIQKDTQSTVESGLARLQEANSKVLESTKKGLERAAQEIPVNEINTQVQEARNRIQDAASSVAETFRKQAEEHLVALAREQFSKAQSELQSWQAHLIQQTKEQLNEVVQPSTAEFGERLSKYGEEITGEIRADIEKSLRDTTVQLTPQLERIADEIRESSSQQIRARAEEVLNKMGEEIRISTNSLAEEAKGSLAALTKTSVESMNREAQAGLEEYRNHLRRMQQEHSEKSALELTSHVEKALEKQREALLVELRQAASGVEHKSLEAVQAKLQKISDDVIASFAAHLLQQVEGTLDVFTEQLTIKKEQVAIDAADAFRSKIADILFALQPAERK